MSYLAITLIAFGLAMDAFAVAVSLGISVSGFRKRHSLKVAIYFGSFQFIMPMVGYILASFVSGYIEKYDHWVAFLLLGFIGGNMIYEAWRTRKEPIGKISTGPESLTWNYLGMLAIATSIDAMAVGISFAVFEINILHACLMIGVAAFLISYIGTILGKKLGGYLGSKAEIIGGVILIGIGLHILIEHLHGW